MSAFGPRRRGSRWCQICSSTPKTCTFSNRIGSCAARARIGRTWDQSVFQVVPSGRVKPWIVAPSRRSCPIARRIARVVSKPPGAQTSGSCSTKDITEQRSSLQIQRPLRHRIRTGRAAQGASVIEITIRPWPVAMTPRPGIARHGVAGLNHEQQPSTPVLRDRQQIQAREVEEEIASVASSERVRAYTTIVEHRRDQLGSKSAPHRGLDAYPRLPRSIGAPRLNS